MAASNMYSIYKQTHPPTGVEYCLYCHFFNKHEKSLVVAGVNHLRVFKLTPDFESASKLDKQQLLPEGKIMALLKR